MDDQNKNLILATALSFIVILVWFVFFPPPEPPAAPATPEVAAQTATPGAAAVATSEGAPATATDGSAAPAVEAPRVRIETPLVAGSISLAGARIDDLSLKAYKETLDPGSPNVTLLAGPGHENAIYAYFGWGTGDAATGDLPGPDTIWTQVGSNPLTVADPVTLSWTSDRGLTFTRTIAIDDAYMFTVSDRVENTGTDAASLYAFGVVERVGVPNDLKKFFILHEGIVGLADNALEEIDYKDVAEAPMVAAEGAPAEVFEVAQTGWIGFTDHFWQTILIPERGRAFTAVAKHYTGADLYRTVTRQRPEALAAGATLEVSTRLFAGPKEWEVIRRYQNDEGVDKFIDSIDWGWFFFLTKPIFAVLHWLHALIGNMGLAIIGLTLIIKAILFPLARKSYISMARMKELQPEMEKLKERVGDDRARMQKEMMELYKREKVNPAAGCLPILMQIPIFFSLYKVIFVTIELRHAPFFGWLRDLSAPDPSSILNLYGLLPFAAPEPGSLMALIFIGVLPLLLGISMWLQQKLNPAPTDATQAMIFAWMPWVFMFMLGSFASGLIVYWIANNTITFSQQYIIMRTHGHKPDIFGNIRSSFGRKKAQPDTGKGPAAGGKPKKK
jgi:YidC/Oxa1 family membrane protein insertase